VSIFFAILLALVCVYFFWFFKKDNKAEKVLDQLFSDQLLALNVTPADFLILQSQDGMQKNSSGNVYWSRHILIRANKDEYISMALTTDASSKYIEYISELRARRALFNKPKKYLAAFGENPDLKQLARLMTNEAKIEP
jgi:hypothetical protein